MSFDLMNNLYQMQQKLEDTDCCFAFEIPQSDSVKTKPKVQLIYGHKLVLSAASPFFKAMLSEKWLKDEKIVIKEVSFNAFDAIIKAIYTGKLNLGGDLEETMEIFAVANMYQIDYVINMVASYMIKLCSFRTAFVIPFLNQANLFKHSQLQEACLNHVKEKTTEILSGEEFLLASTESINLIYSLEQLTIDSDNRLVSALERYLKAHPETRSELEGAINNIRFLSLDENTILECEFIDTDTKQQFIELKNNPELPNIILQNFSKKRDPRSTYKLLSTLPSIAIVKMYEFFNDRYCFLCKSQHNSLTCSHVLALYKSFTYLGRIYSNNYSHTCLERYSNEHINSILQTLKKLAIDEQENKKFNCFLDL